MIKCYTGMPGSGKSFALTNEARIALKQGRTVYSSFYIKGAHKITFKDICEFAFPKNSVVIVDEAGRWFNSRSWSSLPSDVFDLFTMHRHMKLDLILGVQNFKRIDVSLREVIQLTFWARNIRWLPWFIHEGYYDLEKVGNMRDYNLKKYVWKSKKVKEMYDTHSMASNWDDKPIMPKIPWQEKEKLEPMSNGRSLARIMSKIRKRG